jgi:hypothetical protein
MSPLGRTPSSKIQTTASTKISTQGVLFLQFVRRISSLQNGWRLLKIVYEKEIDRFDNDGNTLRLTNRNIV